jgi:VIT1/CCC1 family predicted Fe2+/Mn2+ transporter
VNVLGIILGLSAATHDVRLILVATLAALGAESISMGAVAYTSTSARRRLYLSEKRREKEEMRDTPHLEKKEVEYILRRWGTSLMSSRSG